MEISLFQGSKELKMDKMVPMVVLSIRCIKRDKLRHTNLMNS